MSELTPMQERMYGLAKANKFNGTPLEFYTTFAHNDAMRAKMYDLAKSKGYADDFDSFQKSLTGYSEPAFNPRVLPQPRAEKDDVHPVEGWLEGLNKPSGIEEVLDRPREFIPRQQSLSSEGYDDKTTSDLLGTPQGRASEASKRPMQFLNPNRDEPTDAGTHDRLAGIAQGLASLFPYSSRKYLAGMHPGQGEVLSDLLTIPTRAGAALAGKFAYGEPFSEGLGRLSEDKGTTAFGSIARDPRVPFAMAAAPVAAAAAPTGALGLGLEAGGLGLVGMQAGQGLGEAPSNPTVDFISNALGPVGSRIVNAGLNSRVAKTVADKFKVPFETARDWVETYGAKGPGELARKVQGLAQNAEQGIKEALGSVKAPFLSTPKSVLKYTDPFEKSMADRYGKAWAEHMANGVKPQAPSEPTTGISTMEAVDDLQRVIESKSYLDPLLIKRKNLALENLETKLGEFTDKSKGVTIDDLQKLMTPENLKVLPELREWFHGLLGKAALATGDKGLIKGAVLNSALMGLPKQLLEPGAENAGLESLASRVTPYLLPTVKGGAIGTANQVNRNFQ